MPIEYLSIDSLKPYDRNPRTHPSGQIDQLSTLIKKYGFHESHAIAIDEDGLIIWGHGRLEAAKQAGLTSVPVEVLTGLSEADKQALRIADNGIAEQSDWDIDFLKAELIDLDAVNFPTELLSLKEDLLEQLGSAFDPGEYEDDGNEDEGIDDTKYTKKVDAPIYEITGDNPNIEDLYDTKKADKLKQKINNADIPDDIRRFLVAAANRHTVFTFDKIAEFYAHSDKQIQELMEESALVIIDFNRAIENGFVQLSENLKRQYIEDGYAENE